MTGWSTVRLIARREVQTRLVTKGSLWSVGTMVVVIVAAIVVASILINREEQAQPVAVTAGTAGLGDAVLASAQAAGQPLTVRIVDSDAQAQALTESGDVVAAIAGTGAEPQLIVGPDAPASLHAQVQRAVGQATVDQAISELGGNPAQVQQRVAQAQVSVIEVGNQREFDAPSFVVALAVLALLFYLIVSTGTQIATGVVEEKAGRIVEILLATVRPWQLLAGKVLGIGIVGFIQVAVLVVSALVAAITTGLLDGVEVPIGGVLIWSSVWLVLGFLLYSVIWGGAAALVARQEEIGQVTGPLMMVLFIPFYATMFVVVNDPSGSVARLMTFIPFSAPFAAPVRYAYDAIGTVDMLIGVAGTLIAIVLCTLLAGKVYQRGVVHTGGRLGLRQALRAGQG